MRFDKSLKTRGKRISSRTKTSKTWSMCCSRQQVSERNYDARLRLKGSCRRFLTSGWVLASGFAEEIQVKDNTG